MRKGNDFKHNVSLMQCTAQVSVTADVGGRTVNETVQRSMQHMLSTSLALQFNVFGRHGKRAFGTTNHFSVLFCKCMLCGCLEFGLGEFAWWGRHVDLFFQLSEWSAMV